MPRVIAGSARRLTLKTLDGMDTRPTTDRIKETLFNILNNDMPGATFVDLFSGSGSIGIEALSRGAKKAYLVENNKKAVDIIKQNLIFTKLDDRAEVMAMDAITALRRINDKTDFADVIYADPPYKLGIEERLLSELSVMNMVTEDTMVIIEADLNTDFSFVEGTAFNIDRIKEYKTNKHIFLSRK